MTILDLLSPEKVLRQVADAIPDEARRSVIVIGSLAAAFRFFEDDEHAAVRTKDVDAMAAPGLKALMTAKDIAEQLLSSGWTQRVDQKFGPPGSPMDDLEALPMVRLRPPGQSAWFLELLAAPISEDLTDKPSSGKRLQRLVTAVGDFVICSFDYLALAEWRPFETRFGVKIARPEMMALANLLHHPRIGEARIGGTDEKRSNKDLGRVLALAYLALERDRRLDLDEFAEWPVSMWQALQDKFGQEAAALALRAGQGIAALLASPPDLQQALVNANNGLLASKNVNIEVFAAVGRQLTAEVIEPLAAAVN
ncbi:hypothetical protein SNE35_26265 [Paucibacter sp. R3-3]|uniref:Nucleotidyltransferase n=1 Tax=Roseateles agri TaxID=3098619 RepID=A0ABU5DSI2_9BURK|nr:hypothetical protein [Paucibacter sp. R3-3]MDY0748032.1 hypothetical protein [Paucibacter sp. R3-3]